MSGLQALRVGYDERDLLGAEIEGGARLWARVVCVAGFDESRQLVVHLAIA